MKYPLVSIIIPLYGDEKFIPQALLSVFNQTYSNIEMIIVGDSSNEKSLQIADSVLKEWEKAPINKNLKIQFKKEGTQNLPDNINQGLKLASGQYLTILNSIDYYHPERITKLMQKAQEFELHLAFTRVIAMDHENKSLIPEHPWRLYYEDIMFHTIHSPTLEFNFLKYNLAICSGNLLFSRKLYEIVNHFRDFKCVFCQDFILRAIQHFEINFVNEELYYIRLFKNDYLFNELHGDKTELKQIQFEYFLNANLNSPSNQNAPSPWHWPHQFYKLCDSLHFNDSFGQFIQKPSPESINSVFQKDSATPVKPKGTKKISLISHDLALGGGAPKLLLDLALELRNAGYSPSVLSLADGPLKLEFEKCNIPVDIVPRDILKWKKKYGKLKRIFLLFRTILYINLKTSSHIIINSSASWPFALPFSLFSWFKNIHWYIHESYSPMVYLTTGLAKKLLSKSINKGTFSFWFGSDSTKNIWTSAIGVTGKTKYWSGIAIQKNLTNKEGPIKNLLTVGTCHARKGTQYLVDAFISCITNKQIADDVFLTIIGMPDKMDHFNARIILKILKHNLQHRIKLISCISIQEIETYYKATDLFIQASILECMPLSLLKAMSQGIPTISTDVNGCSEAIQHHVTGYLCRPFSSIALADSITEAVQNFEQTRKFGKNAQIVFKEKFAQDITVNEILKEINI